MRKNLKENPIIPIFGQTKKEVLQCFQEDDIVILHIDWLDNAFFEKTFDKIHPEAVYGGIDEENRPVFTYNGLLCLPYNTPA